MVSRILESKVNYRGPFKSKPNASILHSRERRFIYLFSLNIGGILKEGGDCYNLAAAA